LELAATGLFRAKWTNAIHDEWIGALLKNRKDLNAEKLARTRELMDRAIPDCLVDGYEGLIDGLKLRDTKDRHVLAAAIHSHCDAIITFNLGDFPKAALEQYDLEVQHPDEFIHHQFSLNLPGVLVAARNCRMRLKNPPIGAADYLRILRTQSLLRTATELSPYHSII
jgi:predicted nucleic acid-binding protein